MTARNREQTEKLLVVTAAMVRGGRGGRLVSLGIRNNWKVGVIERQVDRLARKIEVAR